jgi:hypothetical protein
LAKRLAKRRIAIFAHRITSDFFLAVGYLLREIDDDPSTASLACECGS